MQIHFKKVPWDIRLCIGYSVAFGVLLVGFHVTSIGAVFLIFGVPGYVLVALVFPSNREIDWPERIALSTGLSMAVIILLGLLLAFTPFGIRAESLTMTSIVFTVVTGFAAHRRRTKLPPESRLSATVDFSFKKWMGSTVTDRATVVLLSTSILIASAAVAYTLVTPRPDERFTEFYLLGPGGNATDYPSILNASQPGSVVLGVMNHEQREVNYSIRVDLVGARLIYNATSGINETVDLNRTTWAWLNFSLQDGRIWSVRYTFALNTSGLWKLQFLLSKDGNLTTQELVLLVRVR